MQTIDLAPHRLADIRAANEAVAALRRAAERAHGEGPLPEALVAFARTATTAFSNYQSNTVVAAEPFHALIPGWIKELRTIASAHPDSGACTVATAMQLWLWTMNHFKNADQFPVVLPELTEVFGTLLAARCRILELAVAERDDALANDLCHANAARAAATTGTICAELVFGYRRHLAWDAEGCASCYGADELDELEGLMPGIGSSARAHSDVIEADGSHAAKAGPCATADGIEAFTRLRARLDRCLTGARRAKDRAAAALTR